MRERCASMLASSITLRLRSLTCTVLCATALVTAGVNAEEFSWELGGSARKADLGPTSDAEAGSLTATYHFRPVDDAAGPYELAAFLNRSSRIAASYSEDKSTAQAPVFVQLPFPVVPPTPVTIVGRAASRTLSGRHVWRSSGWYAGAALARSDGVDPTPSTGTSLTSFGDDPKSGTLTFGKYVGRATSVELSYEKSETARTFSGPIYCTSGFCSSTPRAQLTSTIETDSENLTIWAQHVGDLGQLTYALFGGVIANDTDATEETVETPVVPLPPPVTFVTQPSFSGGISVRFPTGVIATGLIPQSLDRRERYTLAGELFPTAALGVRLGYSRWDDDASLGDSYDLTTTWFFKRRIGARVVLARTKSPLPSEIAQDVDAVTLQLIGRL